MRRLHELVAGRESSNQAVQSVDYIPPSASRLGPSSRSTAVR